MKRTLFIAFCFGLAVIACRKNTPEAAPSAMQQTGAPGSNSSHNPHGLAHKDSVQYGSRFISIENGNTMISSYLASIGSPQNDSDLRSLTVNADSLRAYLDNNSVKHIKLMFAHTLDWAITNPGMYAGYRSGALTIVIAAYDSLGNYVYYNGNSVLDYSSPCPYVCVTGGNASSFMLNW